jgi:predicted regulator of Ras-like GTPase activity (Roadblock/LC7/MglB family)
MVKKRRSEETATIIEPIVVEEATPDINLPGMLEEIKHCHGVIGYITRNTTSASIDLADPAKIVDYALLSSFASDASKEFSELFGLGNVTEILVDGKDVKMFSISIGETKISIFLEREADIEEVKSKLQLS